MLPAIFGLAGVLLGGVLTAILRQRDSHRERERRGAVAARLMHSDLVALNSVWNVGVQRDELTRALRLTDLAPIKTWSDFRVDIAAVVTESQWRTLSESIMAVRLVEAIASGRHEEKLDDEDLSEIRNALLAGRKALESYLS